MKISKIVYVEQEERTHSCVKFEIDTAEMPAENYAELRFMIDESNILSSPRPDSRHATSNGRHAGVWVTLWTADGIRTAHYEKPLPKPTEELVDCLKRIHTEPAAGLNW
ncbi:MAG: hypothetical protein K2W95_10930 [Candidatus Obscuribacterales bacterium]|nr:hypothetical protein [Candidatus Obscuribacterales bacterium]